MIQYETKLIIKGSSIIYSYPFTHTYIYMFNSSIKNVILLLCVTIIPVFVPYIYLYITDIDRVNIQLQSTCLNLAKNQKLLYSQDLCLSCFYRDDATVPSDFKILAREISTSLYEKYRLNHMKKILTVQSLPKIQQQEIQLSSLLQCQDIIQMIDYDKIFQASKLAADERISEAEFQSEVTAIRQLQTILKMRLSDQVSTQTVRVGQDVKAFGILQIIRRDDLDLRGNLIQIEHPNKEQVENILTYLFTLGYTCAMFCLGLLLYKLITTKTIIIEIFTNITVICGFLASFQFYGLTSNNYFYYASFVLYACITFLKLEMSKIYVFMFGFAAAAVYEIAVLSHVDQLIVAIKVVFCIITIVLIFMQSYSSFEHRPYFIYLWGVWIIVTIFEVQYELYDNFRALLVRDALIIVSVALMEVVDRVKIVFFGEDASNFTKIDQIEEEMMEEQEQEQVK